MIISFRISLTSLLSCLRSFLELRLNLKSPELELKSKSLELEFELKLIVSSGIGIENNRIELLKRNGPQTCHPWLVHWVT